MAPLRGRYRYRFLINARRSVGAAGHPPVAGRDRPPAGVRVAVDIDLYSFV